MHVIECIIPYSTSRGVLTTLKVSTVINHQDQSMHMRVIIIVLNLCVCVELCMPCVCVGLQGTQKGCSYYIIN